MTPPPLNVTKTKKKMHWFFKTVLWLVGIFIVIGIIAVATGTNDEKKEMPTEKNQSDKKWTEVYKIKGNGSKKSAPFHLDGNDVKIEYDYNSGASEIGIFSVFVIEKGIDFAKNGGFPELTITSPKEKSESSIVKDPGDYYLDINSVGNWTIIIKEVK